MPQTWQQRKDKADSFVTQRWSSVQIMQTGYLAQHGRYFQGIVTHDDAPGDGGNVPPGLDRRPTDQAESWRDVGAAPLFPPGMEASAEVHVYDGPQGKGYAIIARMLNDSVGGDGLVYARTWNSGPETWREHDWQPVVEAI